MFVCPGTDCSPRQPSRPCCGTAPTPDTSGTWRWSSTSTGIQAGRALRVTWSSAGSSPPPAPSTPGWPPAPRWYSSAQVRRDPGRRPHDREHHPIRARHAGQPRPERDGKAGLNREILASGWGLLVRRLRDKAPGRVETINPAFTSQRCSACGHMDGNSRESQARFACTACGFACNADVNAARNIAAGHAGTARGGLRDAEPANREPQLLAP